MPTNDLTSTDLIRLAETLDNAIEEYSYKSLKEGPRTHLGISEIGKPCVRAIYYSFRWMKFEDFNGRMLRLFKRGHREEERYVSILEGIGCKVERFDENGKQFRISSVMGHYGGSCDGKAITPWVPNKFLLEFKTHNEKSFAKYLKDGVHKTKPQHIDQMNGYGYHMGLEYAIYFPENKNDDDIKPSVIKLDHTRGAQLERRAEEIITAKEPPARISDNPSFFDCRYCVHKGICHFGETPIKNCRSCRLATPIEGANWHCSRYNSIIPKEFIPNGCNGWTPI